MHVFPTKLIVVNDVFELTKGLLVFTPCVSFVLADDVRLRRGDRLDLRRPDGTVLQTTLYALGTSTPSDGTLAIGVKPFSKADVPIGTEIWKLG